VCITVRLGSLQHSLGVFYTFIRVHGKSSREATVTGHSVGLYLMVNSEPAIARATSNPGMYSIFQKITGGTSIISVVFTNRGTALVAAQAV